MNNKNIRQLAYNTILEGKSNRLPIRAWRYIESNYCLVSYEDIIDYYKANDNDPYVSTCTIKSLTNYYGNGLVIYDIELDAYVIAYNPDCGIDEINWAIAHELGHILMGNIPPLQNGDLYIIGLNEIVESETEQFAYYFLSPDAILAAGHIMTLSEILKTCVIPRNKAMEKEEMLRVNHYIRLFDNASDITTIKLLHKFSKFISRHKHRSDANTEYAQELCYIPAYL